MDWLWPGWLLLLGIIPLIVGGYIWSLRRRFTVRYSSLSLVREAKPGASLLRRHLPFILFVSALASLAVALGRPVMPVEVLSGRTTLMLTLDVSRSMCLRDIWPNRLEAAKKAALSFIHSPVIGTQVGVVASAGFAELVQEPTTDLHSLETAIKSLTSGSQTAIGSAILRSLDAIAEVDDRVAPTKEIGTLPASSVLPPSEPPSSDGKYVPHVIILLTDGASTSGPSALSAAQQAAERGVRIYPIGFGTRTSAIMDCWNLFDHVPLDSPALESRPGSGGFGSEPDEATLKQIAEVTGGKFYSATSAAELQMVFQDLHSFVTLTNQTIEISVFFAALGAMLALTGWILSLFWHPIL
ncbi:MAG TPA: VWA domain-containing protein [Anaerolineales bacterium]|nr:VWA domain-containing protein [Anaerolineales bacterium]